MSQLDETDGEGREKTSAWRRWKVWLMMENQTEIATNFKNQGNDCYKFKQYKNAVEYYTKGLDVKCDVDAINVALYINRAHATWSWKTIEDVSKTAKSIASWWK